MIDDNGGLSLMDWIIWYLTGGWEYEQDQTEES
jgi:hypothetical protein